MKRVRCVYSDWGSEFQEAISGIERWKGRDVVVITGTRVAQGCIEVDDDGHTFLNTAFVPPLPFWNESYFDRMDPPPDIIVILPEAKS